MRDIARTRQREATREAPKKVPKNTENVSKKRLETPVFCRSKVTEPVLANRVQCLMDKRNENDVQRPQMRLDYDVLRGRLLVTSAGGGFVLFHGVPIEIYIGLRFSAHPEKYLKDHLIGAFNFVCSSRCWPGS